MASIRANRLVGGVVVAVATLGITPCGLVGAASSQVSSQVNPVEPQHMLVTDQRAMIRCGAGTAYYPVAELRAGSIVIMDGETSSGWARVKYPESAAALVRTEFAQVSPDSKTLTLSRDDTLVAFNALAGARGSWSKLLAEPAPRGTELTILGEAVNDLSGELAGYRVAAPDQARGYVRTSFLRAATTSEVEAWKNQASQPALAQNEAEELPAADPGVQTPTQTQTQPAATPGLSTPGSDVAANPGTQPAIEPAQDESLVQPMVDETVASTPPVTETPVTETSIPGAQPVDPNAETASSDEPAPLRFNSIEEFEQVFANVQKQTPEEAEYGPLLAEVTRMYDSTPDTPENAGLRTALRQRQSVLKIRQRVQEATRANASLREGASEREQELVDKVRELEIQRSYAVVGRLLPSAVYDGRRLPRMYRIQSLGATEAPRTMGYLRPTEELNLESMLGETIGVVGNPSLDPRLNLMVIEPLKIDVIQAGATPDAGQQ